MTHHTNQPLSEEALQSYMDASPFIRNSGMRIVSTDPEKERLTISMPLKPEFERAAKSGQFHGGPIAALIDTAHHGVSAVAAPNFNRRPIGFSPGK